MDAQHTVWRGTLCVGRPESPRTYVYVTGGRRILFGWVCFLGWRERSVGEQDCERDDRLRLWNTRRRDTVERCRRWRSEPSLPDSLTEHDDRSSARPFSPDTLSLLLELPTESESLARRERRLLRAFSSLPPRGAVMVSDISSIGGQTTIFGVTDSRRGLFLGVRCCTATFTGRSPTNFSLVKKLIPSLFFIRSTLSLPYRRRHTSSFLFLLIQRNVVIENFSGFRAWLGS